VSGRLRSFLPSANFSRFESVETFFGSVFLNGYLKAEWPGDGVADHSTPPAQLQAWQGEQSMVFVLARPDRLLWMSAFSFPRLPEPVEAALTLLLAAGEAAARVELSNLP